MAINLSRNTRVWVSTVTTGHNNNNTFEIPIQEDYDLSQSVASTDINVEEAGPTPTRGSKRFNTNLDPVEWSISTYFSPYVHADSNHYTADMLLWHALASGDDVTVDLENSSTTAKVAGSSTKFSVDFGDNGAHELTKLYFYFKVDNAVYLVEDVQVNQAEIPLDISDIASVTWSGNGTKYSKITAPAFMSATGTAYEYTTPVPNEFVAVPSNKVYLVNKLTTLDFQSDVSGTNQFYAVPITGGSITINNNITYLTPSTLAQVDTPIGSFTGSFEVTGSVEAYLRDTGASGVDANNAKGTTELLEDALGNLEEITNITNISVNIGGATGKQAKITMPTAHMSVPSFSTDEVISTAIEFKAMPNNDDLTSGTEISVEIKAS